MSVAQIKHAFLSIWHRQSGDSKGDSEFYEPETFGSKVRRAYREGKLHEQIQKAEIDYAEGRALDRLY
jgi:hypothetical protein